MFWYRETDEPTGYAARAKAALAWCTRDLGLQNNVTLHWFRESSEHEIKAIRRADFAALAFKSPVSALGMFRPFHPDQILVNISQARDGDTLERTVSHEMKHVAQFREFGLMLDQAEHIREGEADFYSQRATPRIKREVEQQNESELLRLLAGLRALMSDPPRRQAASR